MCKEVEYGAESGPLPGVLKSDSDSEHALAQLKAEQPTVSDAQGGAGRFGQVGG